jgi:hypothetical protein
MINYAEVLANQCRRSSNKRDYWHWIYNCTFSFLVPEYVLAGKGRKKLNSVELAHIIHIPDPIRCAFVIFQEFLALRSDFIGASMGIFRSFGSNPSSSISTHQLTPSSATSTINRSAVGSPRTISQLSAPKHDRRFRLWIAMLKRKRRYKFKW